MYKDDSQLRIEDFVFPYGKLDPKNDWVRLAALVLWEVAEERYAARFVNNTHSNADHIGGNKYLQGQTGCKIYAPGIDCAFTRYVALAASIKSSGAGIG